MVVGTVINGSWSDVSAICGRYGLEPANTGQGNNSWILYYYGPPMDKNTRAALQADLSKLN